MLSSSFYFWGHFLPGISSDQNTSSVFSFRHVCGGRTRTGKFTLSFKMGSCWVLFLTYSTAVLIHLNCIESSAYLQVGEKCFPEEKISQQSPFVVPDDVSVGSNLQNGSSEFNSTSDERFKGETTLLCDPTVPLECLAGRCQCKKGFTINRNGTRCLEIARNGLDSFCEENIQCWKGLLGRMSECNIDTGKCQCYESETLTIVYHRGRCSYGENLGEYCQIEGLCEATTSNATCRLGTCQCREGFVPSWDKSRCLPIATEGLNSTCEENIQCEKSLLGALSECNQDVMKCHCYKIPDMETVFHGGKCYFEAALGDVCQVSAQCQQKTENAVCGPDGKCFCDDGYTPNGNNSICLPIPSSDGVIESSDAKEVDEGKHSPHISQNIQNNDNHHNNNNNNGQCSEDSQCTRLMGPLSRCNLPKQKCECFLPEHFHSFRSSSFSHPPHPHFPPNQHHHYQHNDQENSVISPLSHLTPAKTLHLKSNGVGVNASEPELLDQQVNWNGGTFSSSFPILVLIGNKCYLGKDLGNPCKYNKQCSTITENSWCDNGRCECIEESHVKSEDGRKCLKIVENGLDSLCDEDGQCTRSELGPLSQCNLEKKRCECKNSVMPVVYYKGKCFFHRQLGSSCENAEECQAGSGHLAECSGGRCRCKNGAVKLTPHLCGVNNTASSAVGVVKNLTFWKVLLMYFGILFGTVALRMESATV